MTVALGLDAGTVRVGLAAADPTGTLASAVAVVPRHPAAALWDRVRREASQRGATVVVVGLPRELDGSEGPAAEDARRLAAAAHEETGLPVEMWDERFTSAQAERELIAVGMRRSRRRQAVDGVAAALMLQGWLDAGRGRTGTSQR